jgi:oxygen-dependent protoporphyrinogen oxidase
MSLMPLKTNARVAVVGGGISGTTFAYFLTKLRPDVHITVFEKSPTVGGWISSQTVQVDGKPVLLEKGPRTLRGVRNGTLLIVDTLTQLGHGDQVEVMNKKSIANKKWIWSNAGLIPVPDPFSVSSLMKFLTHSEIVQPRLFWGFLKEPFVKPNTVDESIESFFNRRFGNKILTSNVLSAMIHGIYAGDISKLSIKSIMPKVKYLEKDYGSITKAVLQQISLKMNPLRTKLPRLNPLPEYFDAYKKLSSTNLKDLSTKLKQYPAIKLHNGMQVLPNLIAEHLSKQPNVNFVFNSDIKSIDIEKGVVETSKKQTFDHIRSTINTHDLAKLISNDGISEKLSALQYVNVFLVNVYSKKGTLIPKDKHGFGFLVPRFSNLNSNKGGLLGVIYDSDIEKNVVKLSDPSTKPPIGSSEYEKVTLMMGGWYFSEENPTDSFRLKALKNALADYLNLDLSSHKLVLRDEAKLTDKTVQNLGDTDLLVSYNYLENCIPQYNIGYEQNKEDLMTMLCGKSISLGGMGYGHGIGVPDCVECSFEAAVKLSAPQVAMSEVLISEKQAAYDEKIALEKQEQERKRRDDLIEDEKSRYY